MTAESTMRSECWPLGVATTTQVMTWWRRPDRIARHVRTSSSLHAFGKIRRPTATTVSAARMKLPGAALLTALAFAWATRRA
jgi:hypothetical protein